MKGDQSELQIPLGPESSAIYEPLPEIIASPVSYTRTVNLTQVEVETESEDEVDLEDEEEGDEL